jgi:hypothetical protein
MCNLLSSRGNKNQNSQPATVEISKYICQDGLGPVLITNWFSVFQGLLFLWQNIILLTIPGRGNKNQNGQPATVHIFECICQDGQWPCAYKL